MRPAHRTLAVRTLVTLALASVVHGGIVLAQETADPVPAPDDGAAASAAALTEHVEVTATRLADEPEPARRVAGHVTVVDGATLDGFAAATLQELLAFYSGVVLYDQVGNDLQKTFDLRGFNRGSGTRVYLDGTPLNDARNNQAPLELVPLDALERVEINRGSAATIGGGGTEAGAIHLRTARGERPLEGRVSVAGGTWSTSRLLGSLGGRSGRFDYRLTGSRLDTDGFRTNAGGDLSRLSSTLGLALTGERRLELSLLESRSDLGNPGALTLAEFEADPGQSFNTADRYDQRLRQASLGFRGALTDAWSLSANLFRREVDAGSLSTSRFGGEFSLRSASMVSGTTLQLTHDHRGARVTNRWVTGVEWLDGTTDAVGLFSAGEFADPSANVADNATLALWVQDTVEWSAAWSVSGGLRFDRQEVGYEQSLPESLSASRTYSEVSWRAGLNWNPSPAHGLYLAFGEAFLPPTAEQLFAFPQFGSNPDLAPQDSRSWEAGYRAGGDSRWTLDAALFVVDTDDEIVFVPDPGGIGGENRNAGATRRRGVELEARGRPWRRVELFARVTLLEAEFRDGPNRGNTVPLVPGERGALGVDADLGSGFAVRAEGLWVGEQRLDNDDANAGPPLEAYGTVDARASWTPRREAAGRARATGPRLFVEARNLLDRSYATRGIQVFDFGAGSDVVYVTPAPGRRWLAGAEWHF